MDKRIGIALSSFLLLVLLLFNKETGLVITKDTVLKKRMNEETFTVYTDSEYNLSFRGKKEKEHKDTLEEKLIGYIGNYSYEGYGVKVELEVLDKCSALVRFEDKEIRMRFIENVLTNTRDDCLLYFDTGEHFGIYRIKLLSSGNIWFYLYDADYIAKVEDEGIMIRSIN